MSGARATLREGSVQLAICVAVDLHPRGTGEIRRAVSAIVGRPVSYGTVCKGLSRAVEQGCAVKTSDGFREPFDALSAMDEGGTEENRYAESAKGRRGAEEDLGGGRG